MATTSTTPAAAGSAGPARSGTFAQLLAMEWTKLRSPRSTAWTLLLAAVASIGLTAGVAALARSSDGMEAFDVVQTSSLGMHTAQLFMIALGALAVTAEYTSGSIRTTLAAVAGRGRLMTAKAIVLAAAVWTFGALVAAGSWVAAGLLLPGGFDAGVGEMARTVAGGATFVTLIALLSFGAGLALRSTAAAIALVAGVLAVLPSLIPLLPADVASRVVRYLPAMAGEVLLTGITDPYGPWTALAVLCGWAGAALAAGYGTLRTRDA